MIIAQQRCSCASSKSYAVPEQVIKCVEGKECLINENTLSLAMRRTIILNLAVVVEGWNEPTAVGVSRAVPALPGVWAVWFVAGWFCRVHPARSSSTGSVTFPAYLWELLLSSPFTHPSSIGCVVNPYRCHWNRTENKVRSRRRILVAFQDKIRVNSSLWPTNIIHENIIPV